MEDVERAARGLRGGAQRELGQAVGGHERLRVEAAGPEVRKEGRHHLRADGLGAAEDELDAGEVHRVAQGLRRLALGERKGEAGRVGDVGAVAMDRLQPLRVLVM